MNSLYVQDARRNLLNIYSSALKFVNGRQCVAEFLSRYALPAQKVRVIAIGKAAASMMQGVLELHADKVDAGIIITKAGHTEAFAATKPYIIQLEGAHPYPDQRSIDAGRQLLAFIDETPHDAGLLFLISGGASSLVEVLPDNIDVEQLHKLNRWLLAQGWPIDKMNQVRKTVSLIKAGRLAQKVMDHAVMQLVISDVPGDDLSVIGSGLLVPNTDSGDLPGQLPDWIKYMQSQVSVSPTAGNSCFASIESHIIASNSDLCAEVARQAKALGYIVQCNQLLDGDAAKQGTMIARSLIEGDKGVYVWGGETVVTLPPQPGQGGRCQHLALAAANVLAGQDNLTLLAVGTDGTDGPGEVAGGLVDGQTLQRGQDAGALSASDSLLHADAGSFLAASGDLVDTGPTGTNVMDLVIGLKT